MSTAASSSSTVGTPTRRRPSGDAFTLATLIALGGVLSWYLLPFWNESTDLSHGYFAPFAAGALLWRSRREADWTARWPGKVTASVQWVLSLLGVGVCLIAALAALVQGVMHSQTAFLAAIGGIALLISATLALAGPSDRLVRLNGASICAALLWLFAAPLPSGTLSRFTLLLQDMVTTASVGTLHLLGIAAIRHGNVIELARAVVGVEEACSGIRSLSACLFAGVVFGGLMLTGIRRILLVPLAGLLALVSNLFRSILLCLLAAHGIEINGFWHDMTGYAVLGLTALTLVAASLLLGRDANGGQRATERDSVQNAGKERARRPALGRVLPHVVLCGAALSFGAFVFLRTRSAPTPERTPPNLAELLAIDAQGWARHTDSSILTYSKVLNTTALRQETYFRGTTQLTFYLAYWTSKESTIGSVAVHTPDICLPGSGWTERATPARIAAYPFPLPQRFLFESGGYPQYVWFWHVFGGRLVADHGGLYPWQLAPALLKRGMPARAPQWVIRVSSNRPLGSLLREPLMVEFVRRIRAAGLAPSA